MLLNFVERRQLAYYPTEVTKLLSFSYSLTRSNEAKNLRKFANCQISALSLSKMIHTDPAQVLHSVITAKNMAMSVPLANNPLVVCGAEAVICIESATRRQKKNQTVAVAAVRWKMQRNFIFLPTEATPLQRKNCCGQRCRKTAMNPPQRMWENVCEDDGWWENVE